jgi:hypothetical protein
MMTAMGPGTAIGGMSSGGNQGKVSDGQYTSTIYTMIKDGKFVEVIKILERELQVCSFIQT